MMMMSISDNREHEGKIYQNSSRQAVVSRQRLILIAARWWVWWLFWQASACNKFSSSTRCHCDNATDLETSFLTHKKSQPAVKATVFLSLCVTTHCVCRIHVQFDVKFSLSIFFFSLKINFLSRLFFFCRLREKIPQIMIPATASEDERESSIASQLIISLGRADIYSAQWWVEFCEWVAGGKMRRLLGGGDGKKWDYFDS